MMDVFCQLLFVCLLCGLFAVAFYSCYSCHCFFFSLTSCCFCCYYCTICPTSGDWLEYNRHRDQDTLHFKWKNSKHADSEYAVLTGKDVGLRPLINNFQGTEAICDKVCLIVFLGFSPPFEKEGNRGVCIAR